MLYFHAQLDISDLKQNQTQKNDQNGVVAI